MDCRYRLTESEVINAMQVHGRSSQRARAALCVAGIALVLLSALTHYTLIGFGGVVGGLIGYIAVLYLLIPFKARKHYRQYRALREKISMTLTEQGIAFRSEAGESRLHWNDIHQWKNGNGLFLLYVTSNMFHMVPSRALADENALSGILYEHIGPPKS